MTINTLYELARNSVEKFASKVAFSMFEGDDVTYAEVGRRIEKVQEILTCAGLHAGDKVALLSSNMPNWGVCYFAVTSAGMVAVPILPDFSGEELDMIIAHSEAKALLVSDRLFTKLSKQTIERLNVVVRTKNLGVIAQRVKGEGSMAVPKPDDLAVIIYTSGTTSKPKGVMLTHAALCAQVGISSSIFPVLPDDVFLSVLPLSHTYECSIGMIYPFSMGARVVYLDRPPTASALMPALRAVRPSVMLIVPLIIEKIYRHQVLAKFNSNGFWRTLYKVGFLRRYLHRVAGKKLLKLFGGRLRFLGIGGAKLDGGAEKFLLEAKVPYAIGYGLTNEGDVWDYYTGKSPAACMPIGAVLTIAAAGSEMSNASIITNENGWLKRGAYSPYAYCKFAVMNPELTYTLPAYQTASGCTDIIVHSLERFFTKPDVKQLNLTDGIAETLIKNVMRNVKIALKKPDDYDARAEIMWSGTLSHNDITGDRTLGDWACHQLEHELGGMFDIAHGAGLAAVWGSWARYVMPVNPARFAQLAVNVFGIPYTAGQEEKIAVEGIEARVHALGARRCLGLPNLPDRVFELHRRRLVPLRLLIGSCSVPCIPPPR